MKLHDHKHTTTLLAAYMNIGCAIDAENCVQTMILFFSGTIKLATGRMRPLNTHSNYSKDAKISIPNKLIILSKKLFTHHEED